MENSNTKENIEEILDLISLNTVDGNGLIIPSLSLSSENASFHNKSNKADSNEIESTPKDLFGVSPIVAIQSKYTFSTISDNVISSNKLSNPFLLYPPIKVIEEASESSMRYSSDFKFSENALKTPCFDQNHENNLSWENIDKENKLVKFTEGKAKDNKNQLSFEDISAIDKISQISGFSISADNNSSNNESIKPQIIVLSNENNENSVENLKIQQVHGENFVKLSKDVLEDGKKTDEIKEESRVIKEKEKGIRKESENTEKKNSKKKLQRSLKNEISIICPGDSLEYSKSLDISKSDSVFFPKAKKVSLKPVVLKMKKNLTVTPTVKTTFVIHSKDQPKINASRSEKNLTKKNHRSLSKPIANKKVESGNQFKGIIAVNSYFKEGAFKTKPFAVINPYSIQQNQATLQKIFNVNLKVTPKNDLGKISIKKCLKRKKIIL